MFANAAGKDDPVNTAHGGDQCASLLASLIGKLRKRVARVLPHCAEDGALVLMERIKRSLQQKPWQPFAEISLSAASMGLTPGEDAKDAEKRLLAKLRKQKRASLQLAAFSD